MNPSTSLVTLAGTQNWQDLLFDDLNIRPRRWPRRNGNFVHGGFSQRTERLIESVMPFLCANDEYIICGHSLGGSCAALLASYLQERGKTVRNVYTFGIPKFASREFALQYERQGLWELTKNYVTPRDPVVALPSPYGSVGEFQILPYENDDTWAHHDLTSYRTGLQETIRS